MGLKVEPGHRLLIKSAILMPTAKKDEVTVIQIESEGYNKQKVIVPFCAMKGGSDNQKYVDLLVPTAAKLKIIHGEGPIHLVGSHCVDYFGFKDEDEEDSEEEDDDTENEGMETEQVTEKGDKTSDAKKTTPTKDGKKATPTKEGSGRKASPAKEASEKAEEKKTPAKEDSKKRKASSDAKSAEKKAKS